uniref:Uncharacterized protein n=1 Tax=Moniliophthora roreri TaxID=221103 RepID=A0A0W0F8E8_MONRR
MADLLVADDLHSSSVTHFICNQESNRRGMLSSFVLELKPMLLLNYTSGRSNNILEIWMEACH